MPYAPFRLTVCLVPILLLTACAGGFPDTGDADCGAARLTEFVGQPAVEVAAIETAGPVRILGPNDLMTMDFNPERLNILTDEAGIVTELSCG